MQDGRLNIYPWEVGSHWLEMFRDLHLESYQDTMGVLLALFKKQCIFEESDKGVTTKVKSPRNLVEESMVWNIVFTVGVV